MAMASCAADKLPRCWLIGAGSRGSSREQFQAEVRATARVHDCQSFGRGARTAAAAATLSPPLGRLALFLPTSMGSRLRQSALEERVPEPLVHVLCKVEGGTELPARRESQVVADARAQRLELPGDLIRALQGQVGATRQKIGARS
jgi:hypothetical protein